jgi:hypothetical protein
LSSDIVELRRTRAVGPYRPITYVSCPIPDTPLFATPAGKTCYASVWETDAQFIDRVVSSKVAGRVFVGGLPPMPGTNIRMPI